MINVLYERDVNEISIKKEGSYSLEIEEQEKKLLPSYGLNGKAQNMLARV